MIGADSGDAEIAAATRQRGNLFVCDVLGQEYVAQAPDQLDAKTLAAWCNLVRAHAERIISERHPEPSTPRSSVRGEAGDPVAWVNDNYNKASLALVEAENAFGEAKDTFTQWQKLYRALVEETEVEESDEDEDED